jgi:hypothetical protein
MMFSRTVLSATPLPVSATILLLLQWMRVPACWEVLRGPPGNGLCAFQIGRISELLSSHACPGSESVRTSARLAGDLFYPKTSNQERIADQ